ncbi:MAG: hypothetical protein IJ197_03855 [Bacteroidaceae bacterium]|nr:hypothetical protein [Bacteroidaceae bacterium]
MKNAILPLLVACAMLSGLFAHCTTHEACATADDRKDVAGRSNKEMPLDKAPLQVGRRDLQDVLCGYGWACEESYKYNEEGEGEKALGFHGRVGTGASLYFFSSDSVEIISLERGGSIWQCPFVYDETNGVLELDRVYTVLSVDTVRHLLEVECEDRGERFVDVYRRLESKEWQEIYSEFEKH